MNTEYLKSLTYQQLKDLYEQVRNEMNAKDPERIAEDKRWQEYYAEKRLKDIEREKYSKQVVAKLKKILKPGMRLKMNGCKDGAGIREFIRWDDDNLVCWQISRRNHWKKTGMGDKGEYITIEENTNIVTTHMPHKVAKVRVAGTDYTIKQILSNN